MKPRHDGRGSIALKATALRDLARQRLLQSLPQLLQRGRLGRCIGGLGMVAGPLRWLALGQHHGMFAFVEVAQDHQPQSVEDVVYFPLVRAAICTFDAVEEAFDTPRQVTLRCKLGIWVRGFHPGMVRAVLTRFKTP